MDGAGASVQKSDDTALAIAILVVAVVTAVIFGLSVWNNKKKQKNKGLKEKSVFQEPDGKQEYLQAKAKANLSDPAQRDMLKKMLMRRAIRIIPLIMQLQSEGASVERLYKKGMLTDDVHSKAKELRSFVEREVPECQAEANELADGWGEVFWNQAAQVANTIRQQTEGNDAGNAPAQPASSSSPPPATSQAKAGETEEQKKKKAEAAKLKEKEKKRADKLAAMRSIGTAQADPTLVGDDNADDVARQLIEEEEKERAKQGPKKGKK